MFDPQQYFGDVERALSGCERWAEVIEPFDLKIEFDRFNHWTIIVCRFAVLFPCGHRLTALESHSKRRGVHLRKIKYRLTQPDGQLAFQVDPHQHAVPYDEIPHMHIGPTWDVRIADGDKRLNGYSMANFDFLRMWALVEDYLKDGSVPWQQ